MDKEYAYIFTSKRDNKSSESAVQAWLDKELRASSLDSEAKSLINTRSMLLVEVSIHEEGVPEPLIVERALVPLWHILDDRIEWKARVEKAQSTDNVRVKVLYPKFYQAVANRLTYTRYLMGSIRSVGQERRAPWVKCDLALPQRALLSTEVVLFSVWGVSMRLLAEIWLDVPLIARGPTQWPREIATAWYGMRIGVRAGDVVRYSDNPLANELWVRGFDEPVRDADISIYPRWKSAVLQLPGESMDADQVIEVTLEGAPGQAHREHYVIEVPYALRGAQDWPYYVGMYMSYRSPWINYGTYLEDGSLQPRRGGTNQWYVRCDASQLFIDVRISLRELAHWKREVTIDMPAVPVVESWRQWNSLMGSIGSREITKSYFLSLTERCLGQTGLPVETQQLFKREQSFRYKYVLGLPARTPHTTMFSPPRYKYFSFEQVLLGEPQRRAFFQEQVNAVHVRGEALSAAQITALTGLRDTLLKEFESDIDTLCSASTYQSLFNDTCRSVARVRVGRCLAEGEHIDEDLRTCAFRYLTGELKPRLLMFHEAVVPNVIVLKYDSRKALLISLNATDLKWVVWEPSTASGQPTKPLMRFIAEHMAFPAGINLERDDFFPRHKRYGYHYKRFPPEPITFQENQDIHAALRQAAATEIKQQMNYAVFSSEEERQRAKLGMFKSMARAVAGLVVAAVGPLSGLAAVLLAGVTRFLMNVADVGLTFALAEQADRPEDYAAYIQECKLGVLFAMIDLGADVNIAKAKLRVVLKQSTLASKAVVPILNTPKSYDQPVKLEQVSELDSFLPVPFWLADMRLRMEKIFANIGKNHEYAGYLQASATCGFAESNSCAAVLSTRGWDIQAIGVLIFNEPHDPMPTPHFALSARDQSDTAVIDFTLGHLDSKMIGRAFLGTVDSWEECLRTLPALADKLVVYKCYSSFNQASLELDTLFAQGVCWGAFFNEGSYCVISKPQRMLTPVRKQLTRLWTAVFNQLPMITTNEQQPEPTQEQTKLLTQVSALGALVEPSEDILRRTVGVKAIGELRSLLLSYFRTWQYESLDGYRELMAGVLAEEAALVQRTLLQLEALQPGATGAVATAGNALEDCIDWVAVRAGIESDAWRELLKDQLGVYLSGARANVDLCDATELEHLHEKLAFRQERKSHFQRGKSYEQLAISSVRALLASGLKQILDTAAAYKAECFFALLMVCRPFEDSNELFARVVYSIYALREGRFILLTPAHERRLCGLAPVASEQT